MKNILNIAICALFALLSVSCHKEAKTELEMGSDEGVLSVNIKLPQSRASIDLNTAISLKIYRYTTVADQNGVREKELVRKFDSLGAIPEYIWLIKDDYCAQVKIGEKVLASFDQKYYEGSEDFTITPGSIANVEVVGYMVNIPASVSYDATVANHFTKDFYTYVCASNEFNLDNAKTNKVPTLKFAEDGVGYFILPDGCTNLSWYFYGSDGTNEITQSGVIKNVEAKKQYSLKFKYSKDAPGNLLITATVNTNPDHRVDKVPFSPDPTVKGVGFEVTEAFNYVSGTRTYTVTALDVIKQLNITHGDTTYDLLNSTYAGITVTEVSAKEYTVALSEEFFANFEGGVQEFAFRIKDNSGGIGYQPVTYGIQGVLPINAYDLWFNTADFSAMSFSTENLKIGYRVSGGSWTYLDVSAAGAANTYNASATDFAAARSYEYALFAGTTQVGKSLSVTTPAGAQIPEAGFESWSTHSDEALCPAADPYNAFWDTGNHATAGLTGNQLTTSSTDVPSASTGTYSAYMHSIKATVFGVGAFAAGNLFVGRFVQIAGVGGIVEFGKEMTFTARPKSIRFWVKNNQGTINEGDHTTGTDLAKVYCCLSDRKYTVNTNDEATLFNPSLSTEGVVAVATWETTASNSSWTQITMDFDYKEGVTTAPTHLVLTFTCSGYGDYFTGSTDSYMYVDDVEFVY